MSEFLTCLNTSTIQPVPLLDKIEIAARAGYQALEPWNIDVDDHMRSGGTIEEIKKALADANLRVVSVIALHSWINSEGDDYTRALDECRRRMDQAASLGSPYIVASPPREVVDVARATQRFTEILALGRQAGVTPTMEFLGFVPTVKNVATAWSIAAGSKDSNATVVADVFHMIRGGGTVDDLLALQGSQLSCFHINDVPATPDPLTQTDADRVMLGEGIADLPRVIANLRTIGYRGPISLELFNRALWERDPYDVARVGLERLEALLAS